MIELVGNIGQPFNVVDVIEEVVNEINSDTESREYHTDGVSAHLNYAHGHLLEIISLMSLKRTLNKFPLLALVEDVASKALNGIFQAEYTINALLIVPSSEKYIAEDRYEKSFDPVLTPLYNKFIDTLMSSTKVHVDNNHFDHEPIYRLYYGRSSVMGNISSIFNEPIDAIEIRNLKLKVFKNI